ncbi:hypothetical protein C1I92_01440 [Jiangella anatolica]|uniref:SCP domain-containing protein n=1 Tax=Jiangella anatolica TaxID=2670374 RepID=A0A2W2CDX1_9ACTN|nr:hypothetical protein C1I92_01440 [Jiangella anatolica]
MVLVGLLAIAGVVMAITDGPPVLHARAEGGSGEPDFTTGEPTPEPGDSPSGSPSDPGETPSPSDSGSGDPSEDSSDGPGGSGDSGDGSDDVPGDEYVATTPPRDPDSPDPSEPSEPTEEPSEDPSDEPSPEPSEPTDRPTTEPSEPSEPTDDPTSGFPDLPIIELSSSEEKLLDSAEEARSEAGCPALRVDPRLTTAAREHSEDMRERLYFSHVSPDGLTPEDRAAAEGYTAPVGENLSYGLHSAQQVVRDWEGEERDRLLDCSYTSVGIGVERGLLSAWWTLMLGTD